MINGEPREGGGMADDEWRFSIERRLGRLEEGIAQGKDRDGELRAEQGAMRADMRSDMGEVRAELRRLEELHRENSHKLRSDMMGVIAEFRAEMRESASSARDAQQEAMHELAESLRREMHSSLGGVRADVVKTIRESAPVETPPVWRDWRMIAAGLGALLTAFNLGHAIGGQHPAAAVAAAGELARQVQGISP